MLKKFLSIILIIVILSFLFQIPLLNENNELNESNLVKILIVINNIVASIFRFVSELLFRAGEILTSEYNL